MYTLYISEKELDKRRKQLPTRFKKLTHSSHMQGISETLGLSTRVIGLHQGQKGNKQYKQWRIVLPECNLSFNYFEQWQLSEGTHFSLQKAYLHVYLSQSFASEVNLLFIHCDPQEPSDSPHHRYKVAPHLHFSIAASPWCDVHIPLCDGWQNEVLKDIESLDKAINRAIEFVAHQILPHASQN